MENYGYIKSTPTTSGYHHTGYSSLCMYGTPIHRYNPIHSQQGYSNQVLPWHYIKGEELGISMQI